MMMKALFRLGGLMAVLASPAAWSQAWSQSASQTIDLPTSKQLIGPVPGNPQRINSLPMSMAVSPDGRYVVTVNAGYGTYPSHYDQSFAVMDTETGKLEDFPDPRTDPKIKQTLFSGLAFSGDGAHLYATMGSESEPTGDQATLGNGILVYSFRAGKIAPERFIPLPLVAMAAGRKTPLPLTLSGPCRSPPPSPWWVRRRMSSCWWPTISPMTLCFWTPPAEPSKSASTCLNLPLCRERIPSPCNSPKMASTRLWRFGTLPRLPNSTS